MLLAKAGGLAGLLHTQPRGQRAANRHEEGACKGAHKDMEEELEKLTERKETPELFLASPRAVLSAAFYLPQPLSAAAHA